MYSSSEKKVYLLCIFFLPALLFGKKSLKERVMADVLKGILKLPVFVSTGDMMDGDSFASMSLNFINQLRSDFE